MSKKNKNNEIHNTVQSSEGGVVVQAGDIAGDVGTIVQGGTGTVCLGGDIVVVRTVTSKPSGVVINGANYGAIHNSFGE